MSIHHAIPETVRQPQMKLENREEIVAQRGAEKRIESSAYWNAARTQKNHPAIEIAEWFD